jgi:hypothetical protein
MNKQDWKRHRRKQRKNISHFLKIILVGHTETHYYFIYSSV